MLRLTRRMGRKRLFTLTVAALMVLNVLSAFEFWKRVKEFSPDFVSFYDAGEFYLAGRVPAGLAAAAKSPDPVPKLHSARGADTLHPPFEMLIYALLAFLPYEKAYVVWLLANVAMLWSVPWILWKYLPNLHSNYEYVALLLGTSFPVFIALVQGQDSILLLLLITLAFVGLKKERDAISGLLLGLGIYKFMLVLPVVAALVMARKFKFVAFFCASCVGTLLISIAMVGLRGTLQYYLLLFHFGQDSTTRVAGHARFMPNLRGLITALIGRIASPDTTLRIAAVLSIFILVLLLWWAYQFRNSPFDIRFALFVTISSFASFHFFPHDGVLLSIPLLLGANAFVRTETPRSAKTLLGVAVFGICAVPDLLVSRLEISMPVMAAASALLAVALLVSSRPALIGKSATAAE